MVSPMEKFDAVLRTLEPLTGIAKLMEAVITYFWLVAARVPEQVCHCLFKIYSY